MAQNKEKVVNIFAYKLTTPKYNYERELLEEERYDNEHIIKLFSAIMSLSPQDRPLHLDDKFITLEYYKQSDDADFLEGAFTSAKYGQSPDWVHSKTLRRRKSGKELAEGEENRTHFILDKNTGLFLLQSDRERIVSRTSIDKYLAHHLDLIKAFITDYNVKNTHKFEIYPRMFFRLTTVISEDFYKEIDKLARIKKGILEIDITRSVNSEALNAIKKQTQKVGNVESIGYVVKNSSRGKGLTKVREFFQQLEELNKYNDIIVEGSSRYGVSKTIKMVDHPQKYEIKVTVNNNGIPSGPEMIKKMVYLAKHDSPIRS